MTQIDDKAIGRRLAQVRQRFGIGVTRAATLASVSPESWRGWERGRPMRTSSFLKVAKAFSLSLDWLATGEDITPAMQQIRKDRRDAKIQAEIERTLGGDPESA